MNLLDEIKPTKQEKTFEIKAYEEDFALFEGAINYLRKNKGGNYSQAALFEQLAGALKEDDALMKFIDKGGVKKRGRKPTRIDSKEELNETNG